MMVYTTLPHLENFDIAILGAGPAGCCAALRLLTLGYQVVLIERRVFPRSQIGESLSPGIWDILDYLGASSALAESPLLGDLPTRVIWDHPESLLIGPRGSGGMVNRAEFDGRLLALAQARGARVIQPGQVQSTTGLQGAWCLRVLAANQPLQVNARLILDATGRSGQHAPHRLPTAPATIALWTQIDGRLMPRETCIEATPTGWLWGAPLPNGLYRVMAFLDSASLKGYRPDSLEKLFRLSLTRSQLFAKVASISFVSPVGTCSATPYLDLESWRPGYIKLGEAAFALDPLSSSGVEKALHLTLQAVVAANTLLQDANLTALAQDFYESRLLESAATHAVWTRNYYALAWPGAKYSFWADRLTKPDIPRVGEAPSLLTRFHAECSRRERTETNRQPPLTISSANPEPIATPAFDVLLQSPVRLSPDLQVIKTSCIVADRVQLRSAIMHPKLERPIAFLAGFDLILLLGSVVHVRTVGQLINLWSTQMPSQTAVRIVNWLWQQELLQ
jgi:flavin-dependent dehydrogenase